MKKWGARKKKLSQADLRFFSFSVLTFSLDPLSSPPHTQQRQQPQQHRTGISPLSPLVKSIAVASSPSPPPSPSRPGGRAALAAAIDARFRFLAADAGATLGGRRPSYRDTLLRLRDRLGVRCPGGLRTAELEAEILMHSLGDAGGSGDGLVSVGGSSAPRGSAPSSAAATVAATPAPVQHGASAPRQRARRAAASSSSSPLSSGGSGGVFASAAAALGAAAALEAARGTALRSLGAAAVGKRAAHEAALRALVARAGARGAASVSSAVAVRGAARSAAAAAARYSGARVALSALSAASWAFLAADLGLRAVGTDWSRVEGAVLALAQVRLLRTYGFVSCEPDASDLGSYGGGGGGGVGPAFFSPPLTLPPAAEDMSRSPSRPAAAEA